MHFSIVSTLRVLGAGSLVCVYVCVCMCVYVCVYVCVYLGMCVCMCERARASVISQKNI